MSALALSETCGPVYYSLFLEYLDKQNKETLGDFQCLCFMGDSSESVLEFLTESSEDELQSDMDKFLEKFYTYAIRKDYIKPKFLRGIMRMLRTPSMNEQQLSNITGCSIEAADALFSYMRSQGTRN